MFDVSSWVIYIYTSLCVYKADLEEKQMGGGAFLFLLNEILKPNQDWLSAYLAMRDTTSYRRPPGLGPEALAYMWHIHCQHRGGPHRPHSVPVL